ncbi:hypothetical protein HDU97_000282 [Phlyctochytrium planicorne]|nr:hypothetical protein HDU97_000282 [Phlyctochytrium planicorne]
MSIRLSITHRASDQTVEGSLWIADSIPLGEASLHIRGEFDAESSSRSFDFVIPIDVSVSSTAVEGIEVLYYAVAELTTTGGVFKSDQTPIHINAMPKAISEKEKVFSRTVKIGKNAVSTSIQYFPHPLASNGNFVLKAVVDNGTPFELADAVIQLVQNVRTDAPFQSFSIRRSLCDVKLGRISSQKQDLCFRLPLPECPPSVSGCKAFNVDYEIEFNATIAEIFIPINVFGSPIVASPSFSTNEVYAENYQDIGLADCSTNDLEYEEDSPFGLSSLLLSAKSLEEGMEKTGIITSVSQSLYFIQVEDGESLEVNIVSDGPCAVRFAKGTLPKWDSHRENFSSYGSNGKQELLVRLPSVSGRYYLRLFGENVSFAIAARKPGVESLPLKNTGPFWFKTSGSAIPDNAFKVGEDIDDEPLFCARAWINNGLHLGKVSRKFKSALIAYGGLEMEALGEYEILCNVQDAQWIAASGKFEFPPSAFVGGVEDDGKLLFVGRANLDISKLLGKKKSLVPGKCSEHLASCNIPFDGKEVIVKNYEFLVIPNSRGLPGIASSPTVAPRIDQEDDVQKIEEALEKSFPPPPEAENPWS